MRERAKGIKVHSKIKVAIFNRFFNFVGMFNDFNTDSYSHRPGNFKQYAMTGILFARLEETFLSTGSDVLVARNVL